VLFRARPCWGKVAGVVLQGRQAGEIDGLTYLYIFPDASRS
jgi:hypothetical protein